ncbi:Rz1-like lysis system protein LysC [Dickeya dianthicola]|uniref:Rz1-like lysis system protein LysC n=1 Tax=Dickeya dianthicola TaxID=204039 RepID=UPI001CBED08C|nr:Rz1-like lysis system protein LysC [Dickeya dianthicola]MCA7002166.1 Rz1-like lysis system protein LysC [Dickeya dianthicola]MCI4030731.1 Rz1-like lysis system protein LysC [Dickeya dianthicola]MCI4067445.1 Rz1-like lysis system protein LysC [Dickeya dianthicola]MCI4119161.1 Rz1-like lysis system protein LysC [Dickeya dianthicola]MCI4175783.1 Rz1-like lysis system protein LysC [Dickeya dianthicola]
MILSGCASAPPSQVAVLTVNGCPRLTPCRFPAASPQTNGELNSLLDETEAALATCADQVDVIIACQAKSAATPDATVVSGSQPGNRDSTRVGTPAPQ